MKKYIYAIVAFIACFLFSTNSFAQWTAKKLPADELKGEKACVLYTFNTQNGLCNYWSNDSEVQVHTKSGIFDYDDKGTYSIMNYVTVLMGFYKNGQLVEKVTEDFYVPDGNSNCAACTNVALGKKIIEHLEHGGKIRFVAPRYGKSDFDLTVTARKQ